MHGYHVYSAIWDAEIGEQVSCVWEPRTESDQYAVAVVKDGVVVDIYLRQYQGFVHCFYVEVAVLDVALLEEDAIQRIYHGVVLKFHVYIYLKHHQKKFKRSRHCLSINESNVSTMMFSSNTE